MGVFDSVGSFFGVGSTSGPNAAAYQYGGSQEAADAWRQRYVGGVDQFLNPAARGYAEMAAGSGPSQATIVGDRLLGQAAGQAATTAASARGGAANQLAAQRAGQQQQAAMALGAASQGQQLRAQEQQQALGGMASIGGQYLNAGQQLEQSSLSAQTAQDQARMKAEQGDQERRAAMWGGLADSAASGLSMGAASGKKG